MFSRHILQERSRGGKQEHDGDPAKNERLGTIVTQLSKPQSAKGRQRGKDKGIACRKPL